MLDEGNLVQPRLARRSIDHMDVGVLGCLDVREDHQREIDRAALVSERAQGCTNEP
jgi:hypothetical protein